MDRKPHRILRWRGEESHSSIIPYSRYDETDDERSLTDLRQAYWAEESENYELLIGINAVFWRAYLPMPIPRTGVIRLQTMTMFNCS